MEVKEAGQNSPEKVIVFRGATAYDGYPPGSLILQADLIEERLLTIEAHNALRELEGKRGQIRGAIEAGVPVETGPHTARLIPQRRNGFQAKPVEFFRLVIE